MPTRVTVLVEGQTEPDRYNPIGPNHIVYFPYLREGVYRTLVADCEADDSCTTIYDAFGSLACSDRGLWCPDPYEPELHIEDMHARLIAGQHFVTDVLDLCCVQKQFTFEHINPNFN